MNILDRVEELIEYARKNKLIGKYDEVIARNEILGLLNINEWKEVEKKDYDLPEYPFDILKDICDYAVEHNIIEDSITNRDLFDTKVMGKLTPTATQVIEKFNYYKNKQTIEKATDYYYNFARKTNYIRMDRIAKNMHWLSPTEYGDMEITVNLSKPEKDPRDIAKQKLLPQSSYPKCLLCYDNVGHNGNLNQPARQNHRVIPVELDNEEWFFQYSPYVYYNEHTILLAKEHRPMKIKKETFERLLGFVAQIPHYFLGSNADLPIVGGSILSHDHYQGGHHDFPMAKAPIEKEIEFKNFKGVKAGIVRWPMSVIRINGKNRDQLVELATLILEKWRGYSDSSVGIEAFSGDTPHNTITPIARRRGENYELDLVLRNNRTTEEFPLGIFHPHADVHNIKKENIGLIEVMGLAVLPGRLKEELEILGKYMVEPNCSEKIAADEKVEKHLDWVKAILAKRKDISKENIDKVLKEEVGVTFSKVLEYAGVYKRDEEGMAAFLKFVEEIEK